MDRKIGEMDFEISILFSNLKFILKQLLCPSCQLNSIEPNSKLLNSNPQGLSIKCSNCNFEVLEKERKPNYDPCLNICQNLNEVSSKTFLMHQVFSRFPKALFLHGKLTRYFCVMEFYDFEPTYYKQNVPKIVKVS